MRLAADAYAERAFPPSRILSHFFVLEFQADAELFRRLSQSASRRSRDDAKMRH